MEKDRFSIVFVPKSSSFGRWHPDLISDNMPGYFIVRYSGILVPGEAGNITNSRWTSKGRVETWMNLLIQGAGHDPYAIQTCTGLTWHYDCGCTKSRQWKHDRQGPYEGAYTIGCPVCGNSDIYRIMTDSAWQWSMSEQCTVKVVEALNAIDNFQRNQASAVKRVKEARDLSINLKHPTLWEFD